VTLTYTSKTLIIQCDKQTDTTDSNDINTQPSSNQDVIANYKITTQSATELECPQKTNPTNFLA